MNILITGTNRGIGLALTKQLAASGHNVYATCRTPSEELKSLKSVTIIPNISVDNDDSIIQLQQNKLLPEKLQGVIHNAGVLSKKERLRDLTCTKSIVDQFQTNSLGPIRVFKGVENRFERGNSKFLIISGILASIERNSLQEGDKFTRGGYYGYRMSKAACNMAMTGLSIDGGVKR